MTAPTLAATRRTGLLRLCTVSDGVIVHRETMIDLSAAREYAGELVVEATAFGDVREGAREDAERIEIGDDVPVTDRSSFLLMRSRPTTEDLIPDEGRLVQQHLEDAGVDVDNIDLVDDVARFVVNDTALATRVLEGYGWEIRPSAGSAVWVSAPGVFPVGVEFECEPGIRC